MTKPTKADRQAAIAINKYGGVGWPVDEMAEIIAAKMAPERERANEIGVELAAHQHEVKKLWEREKREREVRKELEKALRAYDEVHSDYPQGILRWALIQTAARKAFAAAEALDKEEEGA